jgi:hypothetical protein
MPWEALRLHEGRQSARRRGESLAGGSNRSCRTAAKPKKKRMRAASKMAMKIDPDSSGRSRIPGNAYEQARRPTPQPFVT